MRKNSIKNTRINGEVQKELSKLISQEVKDPRVALMTSITAVEVAPDLKTAKIFVSVLGSDEEKENTMKGLKSATPFLRSSLAKSLNLRNTPVLNFILDDSIEYGIRMTNLINQMHLNDNEGVEE